MNYLMFAHANVRQFLPKHPAKPPRLAQQAMNQMVNQYIQHQEGNQQTPPRHLHPNYDQQAIQHAVENVGKDKRSQDSRKPLFERCRHGKLGLFLCSTAFGGAGFGGSALFGCTLFGGAGFRCPTFR